MKLFLAGELHQALAHAMAGGQALHAHRYLTPNAPRCFIRAVKRGDNIGHLFDQDETRLRKTARRFGVRVIYVHHQGTPKQHIDLCGEPMHRAEVWAVACMSVNELGDRTMARRIKDANDLEDYAALGSEEGSAAK